jgi:hypothetical protein
MAQPPLYPAEPFKIHRNCGMYSPVESAIRMGLGVELRYSDRQPDA